MSKVTLSLHEKNRLLASASKHGDIDALMIRNWIKDLNYIVSNIVNGNHEIPYLEGTLWIRLYGLLTEIRDNYEYVATKIVPLISKSTDKNMQQVLLLTKDIYENILDISNNLSEEEHLLIDYLRQTNCHVLQKGFRLGVKDKNGKRILKERYLVSTNKVIYLISEIEKKLDIIFKSYRGNQIIMARDICLKIKPTLELILQNSELIGRL